MIEFAAQSSGRDTSYRAADMGKRHYQHATHILDIKSIDLVPLSV